jgi:SPP1 family predicted phage head-tail adaptor
MPAQLQAGDLNRRITLQRATVTTSTPYNEPVEVWGDLGTVAARRVDASAGEGYRAAEVGAQISTRFTVRYSSLTRTLTPKDRISFDDNNGNGVRLYNITGTREPIGTTRQWIEIDAVASADK